MSEEYADLIALMESRAAMYNMFARVYRIEVDEAFLKELRSSTFPQGTGSTEADDAYKTIHRFLVKTNESTLDALAVDYARVFLGSGSLDASAAYPYESVYTSEKRLTMQDARDEVLTIYRSEGFDRNPKWREPEDHIAAELEFMKMLCLRCAEALAADDEDKALSILLTQKNFLEYHLGAWTVDFFKDVARYAKQPFYPAFTTLLEAFLKEEGTLLTELTSEGEEDV